MRLRHSRSARLAHHLLQQRRLHHPLRQDQGRKSRTSASGPLDNSGHGADRPGASFPMGLAVLAFAAQSGHRSTPAAECVFKSTDHGQSWTPDQQRPDAQRQEQATAERRPAHERHHQRRILRHRLRARRIADEERERSGPAPTTASSMSRTTTAAIGRTSRRKMPEWSTVSMIDASPHDAADGLRRRRSPSARRFQALHFQNGRSRENLDAQSPTGFPKAPTSTPCAKIRNATACSTPAPSSAFMSRSTTARTGSRCS